MTAPAPSWLARFRLYAINTLIAAFLVILLIDAMPQSPLALRLALQRLIVPLGIAQGPWTLFAPGPDRTNIRLRVEITYRDGLRRDWSAPTWREQSATQLWLGHRRHEWLDHIVTQESGPVFKPWCRHLARELRPDLENAESGATLRVIYRDGEIAPAEQKPWRSIREPSVFQGETVLTTVSFP